MTDQNIAHYNLLEPLGEGGLGPVFRARDTRVGRTVALKVLPESITGDSNRLEAVLEDARAAAALSHPNIAALFDVGHVAGIRYLAYEFVAGAPLRSEMGGRSMNPRRALELAVQVADGLAEAHAAGVVHGDLRPDTIALTGKGSAKLLDTGMSSWTRGGEVRRAAAADASVLPPEASQVVGYMSPEQALGGAGDGRSDIFSLAAILYELLSGRQAFMASTAQDTALNVISQQPPPPSSANSEIVPELDAIVARALSKDISQRHQSAASFAAELRSVASALDVRAGDHVNDYVLPVDDRADRIPASLLLIGAAAAVAVAAVLWWSLR